MHVQCSPHYQLLEKHWVPLCPAKLATATPLPELKGLPLLKVVFINDLESFIYL
jgi:hypothetical protein